MSKIIGSILLSHSADEMPNFFLIKSIHEKEKLKQINNQHGSWKKEFQEMFYGKEQPFCHPAVCFVLTIHESWASAASFLFAIPEASGMFLF